MSATADRLTVEAGKYHGSTAGETLPRREVVLQAEAEGYTEREAHDLLEGKGQTIEIPEQRDLLGDLWPDNESNDSITQPEKTVSSFRQWLDRKRESNITEYDDGDGDTRTHRFNPEHNWSHYKARQNFAKAKDCDRHFWASYDEFTTVLITRTADENTDPLLAQTQDLTPKAYYQSRYRLLRRLSEDYAALEIRAPKYPTHAERTVRTHVHTGIWLPGHVEPEAFDLLEDKHMATVPGATSCHISVQHHSTDTYPPVENGIDSDRGATTGLPYELAGENQPLMNAETDAADLYDDRALEWCATLSAGDDDSHDTPGMSYWVELGGFGEYADRMAESREESDDSITQPDRTVGLDGPEPSPAAITEPTRESLIEAVAELAQISTPDRRPDNPIDV